MALQAAGSHFGPTGDRYFRKRRVGFLAEVRNLAAPERIRESTVAQQERDEPAARRQRMKDEG
jgi:hypothetical protein